MTQGAAISPSSAGGEGEPGFMEGVIPLEFFEVRLETSPKAPINTLFKYAVVTYSLLGSMFVGLFVWEYFFHVTELQKVHIVKEPVPGEVCDGLTTVKHFHGETVDFSHNMHMPPKNATRYRSGGLEAAADYLLLLPNQSSYYYDASGSQKKRKVGVDFLLHNRRPVVHEQVDHFCEILTGAVLDTCSSVGVKWEFRSNATGEDCSGWSVYERAHKQLENKEYCVPSPQFDLPENIGNYESHPCLVYAYMNFSDQGVLNGTTLQRTFPSDRVHTDPCESCYHEGDKCCTDEELDDAHAADMEFLIGMGFDPLSPEPLHGLRDGIDLEIHWAAPYYKSQGWLVEEGKYLPYDRYLNFSEMCTAVFRGFSDLSTSSVSPFSCTIDYTSSFTLNEALAVAYGDFGLAASIFVPFLAWLISKLHAIEIEHNEREKERSLERERTLEREKMEQAVS
jgi:hypothetical protein